RILSVSSTRGTGALDRYTPPGSPCGKSFSPWEDNCEANDCDSARLVRCGGRGAGGDGRRCAGRLAHFPVRESVVHLGGQGAVRLRGRQGHKEPLLRRVREIVASAANEGQAARP